MMKIRIKHLLLLSVLLLSSTSGARAQDPEIESLQRRIGRISSIRTDISEFSGRTGKWELGPRRPYYFNEYDFNGNLTREVTYKPDGSLEYERIPLGDPNEKVIFWNCSTCKQATEGRIKPHYDKEGRIIREDTVTLDGKLVNWSKYKYDDAGNMTEEFGYERGLLNSKLAHKYDENRKRVQAIGFDEEGNQSDKWEYRYDEAGQLIEQIIYDSDGSVSVSFRYSYDSKGNLIEEAHYDSGISVSNKTAYAYNYDSIGNWIERTTRVWINIGTDKSGASKEDVMVTGILYRTITYY